MKKAILATKVGMTQIFDENGNLVPVTVLQAGPCVVTQVKTVANDGYSAVQVGFTDKREKLVSKPVKGHFDKAGVSYKRYVREFRFENAEFIIFPCSSNSLLLFVLFFIIYIIPIITAIIKTRIITAINPFPKFIFFFSIECFPIDFPFIEYY